RHRALRGLVRQLGRRRFGLWLAGLEWLGRRRRRELDRPPGRRRGREWRRGRQRGRKRGRARQRGGGLDPEAAPLVLDHDRDRAGGQAAEPPALPTDDRAAVGDRAADVGRADQEDQDRDRGGRERRGDEEAERLAEDQPLPGRRLVFLLAPLAPVV